MSLFPGFRSEHLDIGGVGIRAAVGPARDAPAVLLLHGYPQTQAIWHRIAPALAGRFNVVASDLRGYGDSDKPATADHAPYSKRVMAADQVGLMRALGHERFHVVGHDRGARVAHRMAVDHAGAVTAVAVLDIAPTLAMYENTTEAWAEYERCFTPEMIHASCEDYRAAASIDLVHDRADRDAGRKVRCPLLALWGAHGVIERCFRPMDDWRRVAEDVRGRSLPAGHYLPEEVPELVTEELEAFLR